MVWPPVVRLAVVKLAVVLPPAVVSTPCPTLVAPSEKITVPVGFPAAVPPGLLTVTVAVNVTDWPGVEGVADELTPVLGGALLTVWLSEPVLAAKVLSPL